MANKSDLIAQDIEEYLKKHENKELLRFITCGSVDDGKSTLIGRLLYDSKMIFEDQLSAIKHDSKKSGTTGDEIDLALLVDGLASEREQGITIDVAYRYFSTDKRKFIIADTPGHEQYTRNMATGASTADLAIILIDARKGILTQTKRHSYIVSLLGIKNVIVAINKMDLLAFSQDRFIAIQKEYEEIIPHLINYEDISFRYLPISALNGDNIVNVSKNTPWYNDKPLMQLLDTIEIQNDKSILNDFRFPVQYVNRPNLHFRGFCGSVASGSVSVGDEITILPSGKTTKVKSIVSASSIDVNEGEVQKASYKMAVTLRTTDEVDISRGDMIVRTKELPKIANYLKVMLVWMDEEPMKLHKNYEIKRATSVISASFTDINYKLDINSYDKISVHSLVLNDIALCDMVLTRPIAVDIYADNRQTGAFVVIDKITNNSVAAGMIYDINKESTEQTREYSEIEIALNHYIREHFAEWECKQI